MLHTSPSHTLLMVARCFLCGCHVGYLRRQRKKRCAPRLWLSIPTHPPKYWSLYLPAKAVVYRSGWVLFGAAVSRGLAKSTRLVGT